MTGRPLRLLVILALVTAAARGGDGVVALQAAAPSCGSATGRYVDCGNGTVTDNETGLVWLANADCFGLLNWYEAMAAVAGLADLADGDRTCEGLTPDECDCGLSDGSSAGEWRLPTIAEWEAMTLHAADGLGCSPALTNDAGDVCWSLLCSAVGDCSFHYLQSSDYWSSSSLIPTPTYAWRVFMLFGSANALSSKTNVGYVWPVRRGQ